MSQNFVGRKFHLEQFEDHHYHIMSGQPRIVLLEGEAGIGKSRFLQEVITLSESSGVNVCSGYGSDTFSRPYEPFSGLFPALQSEGVFSGEHPSATALVPAAPTGVFYETAFGRAASNQASFMIDLTNASVSLARQAPLMVIVDDLHLADASSLELFDYLAGELTERRDAPILLLGSYRPQIVDTPLAALLDRLREQRIAREIHLGSFSELETRGLVEVLSQQAATQQLVERVQEITQGVPFYIEQLMLHFSYEDTLVDQGMYIGLSDDGLRRSVDLQTPGGMISPRVDALPAHVYDILTVGSFLIEPFSTEILGNAAHADAIEVEQSLEIAKHQGLLLGESDSLRFSHTLVRQVLQNRLSADQRQQVHFDIACALEQFDSDSRDHNILVIAHHIVQAGFLVDVEHTIATTQKAGERAMQVYAWSEAVAYFEAARLAVESRGGSGQDDLASYYYRAAVAHYRNQDVGPAQERFEQAVHAYTESGDKLGLASALMWLTRLGYTQASTPFGVLPAHAERLREVLNELNESDSALCGYFTETLAQAYRHGRRANDAYQMAQRALSIGQQQNDPRLIARASTAIAMSYAGRLDVRPSIENHIVAADSARSVNDLYLILRAISNLPLAHFIAGEFESAQITAAEGAEVGRTLQDWAEYSKCLSHLAGVAAAKGEFETVEQLAQKALDMSRRSRYPWGAYRALQTWAFVLAVRGSGQEANDVLDLITGADSIFNTPGNYERLLTGVLKQLARVYQGEMPHEPIAALCRAFCQEARNDTYSLAPLCATIELAELTANPNLVEVPIEILSSALENGVMFTSGWFFSIPRVLGVAAVLRQEWETAMAHFSLAFQVTIEAKTWHEYSRVCLDYARMIMLIGDKEHYPEAMDAARQGIDILREFGMSVHARRGTKLREALSIGWIGVTDGK